MRRLLLTGLARDDLGLPTTYAGVDAREIVRELEQNLLVDASRKYPELDRSEVTQKAERRLRREYGPLVAFVVERSQLPEGQEWTKELPHNYRKVFNLHAGDDRGVTWWDRDRDIVWLLAAGFHRSGARDDFYPRVVALDGRHELMPDADDFGSADPDPNEEYVRELRDVGRSLLARSREVPGQEVSTIIASRAHLGIYVEMLAIAGDRAEEVLIAVRATPDHHGSDVVADVLVHVIPEAESVDFPTRHPLRRLEPGERLVSWLID